MIIILLICFILFLFALYVLVHDDFIMLRKNVTVEQVFNIAFLVGMISLFSARLVFVAFHFSPAYFNPLVFFLFWYFPGLSLAGGIVGGALFLLFYTSKGKLPVARLFDFFAFALLSVLPIGFLGMILLSSKKAWLADLAGIIAFSLLLLFFALFFLPKYRKARIKEGSLGLYALFFISLIGMFKESLLFLGMALVIGFFLVKRERIVSAIRRKNK